MRGERNVSEFPQSNPCRRTRNATTQVSQVKTTFYSLRLVASEMLPTVELSCENASVVSGWCKFAEKIWRRINSFFIIRDQRLCINSEYPHLGIK